MLKFEKITPTGEMVLLKIVQVKQDANPFTTLDSGLLVKKSEEAKKVRVEAFVEAFGKGVKDAEFKVGDKVMFNDYDAKYVSNSDDEMEKGYQLYILTRASSIMAVLE